MMLKIFTRLSTNKLRKFQLIDYQLYMKSAFLCRVVEAEVMSNLKSLIRVFIAQMQNSVLIVTDRVP